MTKREKRRVAITMGTRKALAVLLSVAMVANSVPVQALAEASDAAPEEAITQPAEQPAAEQPTEGEPTELAEPKEEPSATDQQSFPSFKGTAVVDGVQIGVSAGEGAFPEGATLDAKRVSGTAEQKASDAVDQVRDTSREVVASYAFAIAVLDRSGAEVHPADNAKVNVSFATAEVADQELTIEVFRIDDKTNGAEPLAIQEDGATARIEVGALSTFVVSFTAAGARDAEPVDSQEAKEEGNDFGEHPAPKARTADPHEHNWSWAENYNKIVAACSNGGHEGDTVVVLILNVDDVTYLTPVSVSLDNRSGMEATGVTVDEVTFEGRDGTTYDSSTTAPYLAGAYTAKVTVRENGHAYTAKRDFTITPKRPRPPRSSPLTLRMTHRPMMAPSTSPRSATSNSATSSWRRVAATMSCTRATSMPAQPQSSGCSRATSAARHQRPS